MVNKDFFQALQELEQSKKINAEQLVETLETALTSAYKKIYGEAKSAEVKLNSEKNTINIFSYKTVVEEVENADKEMTLEEAKAIKNSYKIGDLVAKEEKTKDFGRIAAQTAIQVIKQKFNEIERTAILDSVSEKEDTLTTAIVKRIEGNVVYVQLTDGKIEGIMTENDQIAGEKFKVNDRIKVYIKRIKENFKGLQIQVSRSSVNFLKKLFEIEIPEIENGDVEIVNVVRDSGNRSKVAIRATKSHIDALGACVGNRGIRINTIMNEINGEKIDLVMHSEDACEYIAAALSPAKVLSVEINESLKASRVIVPDDKLSLAIGKGGQNVRLAARLTGWKIDVKCESDALAESEQNLQQEYQIADVEEDDIFSNLEDLDGLEEIENIENIEDIEVE